MRKVIVLLIALAIAFPGNSQRLSKMGKIVVDELPTVKNYRTERINDVYKIFKDTFVFEGNSFIELPQGYLTFRLIFDDEKDFIKFYNASGELLKTIYTERIINLKVSDNKKHVVFYNEGYIYLINLESYKIDTIKSSYIYAFVEGSKLIYYEKESKTVNYQGNIYPINEFPSQLIHYKGMVLAISKNNVYKLTTAGFESIYAFNGRFFDAKIVDKEFYFVDKTEKRKNESFWLYRTSDFLHFLLVARMNKIVQ